MTTAQVKERRALMLFVAVTVVVGGAVGVVGHVDSAGADLLVVGVAGGGDAESVDGALGSAWPQSEYQQEDQHAHSTDVAGRHHSRKGRPGARGATLAVGVKGVGAG